MKNMEEISNRESLITELLSLRHGAYEVNRVGTHQRILEKDAQLKEKYGDDRYNYDAFHLLIGSKLMNRPDFDFPGDDSVEKFIRSL